MTNPIIPRDWTACEALAVYEFIDTIREEIWSRYGSEMEAFIKTDRSTNPDDWESLENWNDFDEAEADF